MRKIRKWLLFVLYAELTIAVMIYLVATLIYHEYALFAVTLLLTVIPSISLVRKVRALCL